MDTWFPTSHICKWASIHVCSKIGEENIIMSTFVHIFSIKLYNCFSWYKFSAQKHHVCLLALSTPTFSHRNQRLPRRKLTAHNRISSIQNHLPQDICASYGTWPPLTLHIRLSWYIIASYHTYLPLQQKILPSMAYNCFPRHIIAFHDKQITFNDFCLLWYISTSYNSCSPFTAHNHLQWHIFASTADKFAFQGT